MKTMRQPSSDILRLLKLIFSLYKWRLMLVLALIVISSLCTLMMTLFTKVLIDDYILVMLENGSRDFSPLVMTLIKLSIVLLLGIALGFIWNLIMIKVGQGVMRQLREDLFDHMQTLRLGYFDSRSHGEVMSVFINDIDTLRQVISRTIPQVFSALITLLSTLVSMIILSISLTVVTLLTTVLMLYVTMRMASLSKKYFSKRQEDLASVNGYVEEMVSAQKTIKVFRHEKRAFDDFEVLNESLKSSVYNANKIANIIMPVNVNMTNLGYMLIAFTGALLSIHLGQEFLSLGTLVAYLTLHKNFSRPISTMSQEVNNVAMAAAGAARVFAMQDEQPEENDGDAVLRQEGASWSWIKDGQSRPLEGLVCFDHVNFSYDGKRTVLHDISLTAYPGQKIALVGSTGAGKTTITNLISRFYEIQDGSITYDGLNIRDIEKESLRKSLGFVLQDTCLFTGTIMENIRYGRLEATDEECRQAANLALADGFIRRLPKGYDTVIHEGGEDLSQGERQLLSIARTAVSNPPVLVLDEATSSIDTRSERLVQRGMDRIMKGRTTFVIAHRLSTILSSDYIIVLEKGRIIEAGKHQELLDQKGRYFELYMGGAVTD